MEKSDYKRLVERRAARSPVVKNCTRAFLVGGGICAFGQGLILFFSSLGASQKVASTLCTVTLIFLAALLTGVGVFDRIARYAGAGTLLPVTGFANAVVSPAIDNKSEGYILGLGAKIYIVAGPVILYATLSGVLYGVIYYLLGLWG